MKPPQPGAEVKKILYDLRFKRYMVLSRDLPRIKGACAWCRNAGRQGLKYCSEACHNEADIRSNGNIAARYVRQRDKGVCTRCGIDTNIIANVWTRIVCSYNSATGLRFGLSDNGRSLRKKWLKQWGPWERRGYSNHFAEIHHILPVHKGGGCCGIDNLETLCIKCHKAETKRKDK